MILRLEARTEVLMRSKLREVGRMVGATNSFFVLEPDERSGKRKRKPFAFIMIRVAPEEVDNVLNMLLQSEEVQSAEVVAGVYDIIAEVAAEDEAEFLSVMKRIWRSQTVPTMKTTTMPVIREI